MHVDGWPDSSAVNEDLDGGGLGRVSCPCWLLRMMMMMHTLLGHTFVVSFNISVGFGCFVSFA